MTLGASAARRTSGKYVSRDELDQLIADALSVPGRDERRGMIVALRISDPQGIDARYGAGIAVECLRRAVASELSTLRASDYRAPWDEHSVVVYMPHADLEGASSAARRLAQRLDEFEVEVNDRRVWARYRVQVCELARYPALDEHSSVPS